MSASNAIVPGVLYVVATPIGNLGDLSPRARVVLGSVALIAAEDTRHTGQMLQLLGIARPMTSLHEHNEESKAESLISRVAAGESIAVVSDAGTPAISDPGFALLAAARRHQVNVIAIPGPCAAIAALSVSGLPTDRFAFEGFLPAKSAARRAQLQSLAEEPRTLVFYEGPHRIVQTLEDMSAVLGADREASISREISKRFETTYRGTLAQLVVTSRGDGAMTRGELVIVVSGNKAQTTSPLDARQLLRALVEELSPSQAAKIAARLTGEKRSELYEAALMLSGKGKAEGGTAGNEGS